MWHAFQEVLDSGDMFERLSKGLIHLKRREIERRLPMAYHTTCGTLYKILAKAIGL